MKVLSSRRGGHRGFDWGGHATDAWGDIVELYPDPGAWRTLRELATNPKYREVKIPVPSTSLEPAYSMACIDGIGVVEGVTMGDMIHEESGGVPYGEMLLFDNCNWAGHVGDIDREFGVLGVRTGSGYPPPAGII